MRIRFSIARLVAAIVFCGVAFAALRSPSPLWGSVTFSLALAILVAAIIYLIVERGRRRAYWVGFAIGGWAYVSCVFGPWLDQNVGSRLVTTALMDIVYPSVVPSDASAPTGGGSSSMEAKMRAAMGGRGGMMSAMGRGGGTGRMLGMGSTSPPPVPSRWTLWTGADTRSGEGSAFGQFVFVAPATFRIIGHSLIALVVAALSGLLARRGLDRGQRVVVRDVPVSPEL